jgi:hypothetical protein
MQTLTTYVCNLRTFQEYFLSPRTIFSGHQPLMWECSEISRDEWLGTVNFHNGAVLSKSKLFEDMSRQSRLYWNYAQNSSTLQWSSIWSAIVREYRARILTVPEDRIMAFAGIARATHKITRKNYLAGLWAEELPSCLLWRVGYQRRPAVLHRSKDLPTVEERAASIAPS